MAEGKKSVLMYCDLITTVEKMTDANAGKFLKHYLRYVNDQNPEPPNAIVEIAFEPVKQQLKRDLKAWEKKSKKNSESASKRWEDMRNNANASERTNRNAKNADTDTVTVTDTVTDRLNNVHEVFPGKVVYTGQDLVGSSHLDVIAMELKISEDQLQVRLDSFLSARKMDQKTYPNMVELRSHFVNYCRKFKPEPTGNKTINRSIKGKPL